MLYFSLLLALVLVVAAHTAARPHPLPTRWNRLLGAGAGAVLLPGCLCIASPVNAGLFALLALGLLVWPVARHRLSTFFPLSVAALLTAYGVAGWYAWKQEVAADRLRAKYPFEPMADRVPEPRGDLRARLSDAAVVRLNRDESATENDFTLALRAGQFRRLHESTVNAFVHSPGFGVGRIRPFLPTEEDLRDRSPRDVPPAQPGAPSPWPPDATFEVLSDVGREAHCRMHAGGLLDFVNPAGWGYIIEGRRAAGFLRHAFSRVPEPAIAWRLEAVELIGLLRHPEPVVYRSGRLPAMADLRDAPTRPLDRVEAAALAAVRKGEDGFAARWGDELKFVGGIRSAHQCVSCHGGARGDLLGAFSYSLRADPHGPVTPLLHAPR